MMRFRFPYPPLQVAALVAVVAFAAAYAVMTQREVAAAPGAGEATPYVLGMAGFTVALALFVGGVLWYRARLVLEVGDGVVVLERLHWRRASRRIRLEAAQIERVQVRPDARGIWYLWLESGLLRHRLPLMHARVEGARGRAPQVHDAASAAAHPLVAALAAGLGERVVIEG